MASGVDFVACDNPHAKRLTIEILAAMAEHESRLISERVKASVASRRVSSAASISSRLRLGGTDNSPRQPRAESEQDWFMPTFYP